MQTFDKAGIQQYMTTQMETVFETMFSMHAVPESNPTPFEMMSRVSGSVGFGGETITGAVYLHLPDRFASLLAGCMLGTSGETLSEPEINDVVGELTNMLTGGLKSWLCDVGAACAVSTPAVIRGSAYAIEAPPGVQRLDLAFSSGPNRFAVEIHYKTTAQQPQNE